MRNHTLKQLESMLEDTKRFKPTMDAKGFGDIVIADITRLELEIEKMR